MKYSIGLDGVDVWDLYQLIKASVDRPKIPVMVDLWNALRIVLEYLRTNRTQADIAYFHGVSQSTVSRVIAGMLPVLAQVLERFVPSQDDLRDQDVKIVDPTLCLCWSHKDSPDLYSGKHHTTGHNIQVVVSVTGRLLWVSDPMPGSTHDTKALDETGLLDQYDPENWIADKGYIGRKMRTPIRKKPGQKHLTKAEKIYNKEINKIRYTVERAIAHLKTWRILHTDYRKPLNTFKTTLKTILGLHFRYTT